ncbi:general secretion pathway protein GspB [Shewanella sp. 202IG2-18]|uniref:general secretion pathway protein GspB n=1 Tax=Parashewanella hymeniacidonis TaxID=2807618 RepID=UPI001961E53C|nr:general secretion pathway protein GspB [Parashewanella hymeniacidonis]MBM7073353.1 general secretion pathway protein GspB [Parashewanella hymeniacidonis]
MSILLDAVTKSKQQQTDVIDPALTPRQQYAELHRNDNLPVKIVVSVLVLLLAIAAAWWLARSHNTAAVQAQKTSVKESVKSATLKKAPQVELAKAKIKNVEIAGKSALPISQVYSPTTVQARPKPVSVQTANNAGTTTEPLPTPNTLSNQAAEQQNVSLSEQNSSSEQSLPHKPIILGRQPSEDELAIIHADTKSNPAASNTESTLTNQQQQKLSLEALKRQIDAAATDVGLKTQKQHNQDELVKELNEKLRNTEREKSIQASDKKDSMMTGLPKTKYPNMPSYGELPAGVQLQVPEFSINAHMYSSIPSQRRLSVNGQELKEGDKIGGKLKILEIRPRDVVLEIAGEKFRVPAM